MTGYIVRRVMQAAGVLFGVSILVFLLIHVVPGDPVRLALGTRFDPETYEALRQRAGLDQPLIVQYFNWITSAATGDLGVSFRSGRPVTQMILGRLPATLSLAFGAIVVALVMSFTLGTIAALRQGSKIDHVATAISQFGISIPDFWMGILLILLFGLQLDLLPPSGYVSPLDDPWRFLQHLVMPAVTVGVVSGSILTRFVRSSVLEALGEDYTRTARSKGLRERTILVGHILRNALIPTITVTGLQLAYLLSGVVVIEVVFSWSGLGLLAYDAVLDRDYPVLQGAVLLFAVFFLLVNLIVDLLYSYVDPRIRY